MATRPTGQVMETATGRDLVLLRALDAPVDDVWASLTEPAWTRRWFGDWRGEPGAGQTIHYTMSFEGDAPLQEMLIEQCEPPQHLHVTAVDEYGSWDLEVQLTATGSTTQLTFIHHLDASAKLAEVGPGWEYYLDNLVAARSGVDLPSFDDYFPAQQNFYEQWD